MHHPRQDNTYHGLCYTSRGALAGTRNSSMGPPHEGSIRRPTAPWANALPLSYVLLLNSDHFPSLLKSLKPFGMLQPVLNTYSVNHSHVKNFIGSIGTSHHIPLCYVSQKDFVYTSIRFSKFTFCWNDFFLMEYTESIIPA